MNISEILTPERIVIDLAAASKVQLLHRFSESASGALGIDESEIFPRAEQPGKSWFDGNRRRNCDPACTHSRDRGSVHPLRSPQETDRFRIHRSHPGRHRLLPADTHRRQRLALECSGRDREKAAFAQDAEINTSGIGAGGSLSRAPGRGARCRYRMKRCLFSELGTSFSCFRANLTPPEQKTHSASKTKMGRSSGKGGSAGSFL
ncbi:hypothetical protein ABIE78_004678 [Sinorhizobium fredii]